MRPWRSPGLTVVILVSSCASIVIVISPSVCTLSLRLIHAILILTLLSGGRGVSSTGRIFYTVLLGVAVVVHLVVGRGRVAVVDVAIGI